MGEDEHFHVAVVGSGFGGSVTACRLAEAGLDVVVLERGQPYPPGSFPRTPREVRSAFWDPAAGLCGLYEFWDFGGLKTVCSSGLGGGSLIYANVMIPKDEHTFAKEDLDRSGREHWPIGHADLAEHYDRVEDMQQPRRYPDTEPYASTPKTLAIREAAAAVGAPFERPKLAIRFSASDDVPAVPGAPIEDGRNLHHAQRFTCRLCGECCTGCNFGAKNTLDYTYLSAAPPERTPIRTCCEVSTIEPLDGNGFRVGYRQHLDAKEGHLPHLLDESGEERRTVHADRVIIAAGALGSTRLLLSNRASLPGLSPALGTRVSANGDALAWAIHARTTGPDGKREPRYLEPSRGPVITESIYVDEGASASGRGYRIQDAGAPVLGDWAWQGADVPRNLWGLRRLAARRALDALLHKRDTNASEFASDLFAVTDSAALLPLLAMGRDVPGGRFTMIDDRLELDWEVKPSKEYYKGLNEGFEAVARALGGKLRRVPFNPRMAAHPLGGCPMGDNERHGVVDSYGEVFGYPGLYVADGAAMPGPVGPNPSFTIAAFADRVADGIIEERSRRERPA
jgi:cholesterol oxidase